MTYLYKQKIKNSYYVYEIKSHWDKDKKQPRQKRRYLGKVDEKTGEIIPPCRNLQDIKIKSCKDFGNIYLLNEIINEIDLKDTLKEHFHCWKEILACAFFEIFERKPLYLCNSWLESTTFDILNQLNSQRISELLKDIGEDIEGKISFFKEWAARRDDKKVIIFDITSFSSYSKLSEWVEWGYNRDDERLPQINFGLAYAEPSSLPIFYTIYEGSIKDVSTLKNIMKFCKILLMEEVIFVLDKGFYSAYNLSEIHRNKGGFIISVPFSVGFVKELIKEHRRNINNIRNAFQIGKQIIYGIKDKVVIDNNCFNVYIYYDEKRKVEAKDELIKRVFEIEKKIKMNKWREVDELKNYLNETFNGWKRLFDIEKREEVLILSRKEEEINEIIDLLGYSVIVSNNEFGVEEVISHYRRKDVVEKVFDVIKNELNSKRLRVHSREVMEGRLFITFIAVIIYSWITKKIKEKDLGSKYTFEEIMYEVKKIKRIDIGNGKVLFTEISKKQREIFKALDIKLPPT